MTRDERRSAHLLFAPDLADGLLEPAALEHPAVVQAVASARVPSLPARWLQRRALSTGGLSLERDVVAPLMAARRAVLGDRAAGLPRLLVRVDEVPHVQAADDPDRHGTPMSERFHRTLRDAGVPYLAAVLPRVPHDALDPDGSRGDRALTGEELELLWQMRRDGVAFALHGLNHRTRHRSPRRRSELTGLRARALERRLDRGGAILREAALHAPVFVPPFNRFGRGQWPLLAARYEVICGGPESIPLMGFHRAPLFRGAAVWFPSYPPLYERARNVLPAIDRLAAEGAALWLCITLHPGWEAEDGWRPLELLCERIAPITRTWDEFLTAVALARRTA